MRSPLSAALALAVGLATFSAHAEGELSLEEAVQLALRNQPQIVQAAANVEAARGRSEQARSTLLPQINGIVSAARSRGSSLSSGTLGNNTNFTNVGSDPNSSGTDVTVNPGNTNVVSTTGTGTTSNRFVIGLSASQVVWDFSAIENFRATNRLVEAERAQQRAVELQVVLSVRTAFFSARAQRDLIAVAEENLQNNLQHQRQIEGFVRAGINPEIDLARVRTDVANAQVQLINASNSGQLALARLHQAMGVTQEQRPVSGDQLPEIEKEGAPLDALVDEALHNRPELATFFFQQQAQELTVTAAQAEFLPAVRATGSTSEVGSRLPNFGLSWSFGASLTWPLLEGGLTLGRIHEARANVQRVVGQGQAERLQVRLDVESAQLNLAAGKKAVDAAKQVLTNARVLLRLAERRYEVGLGSIIELGDAQVAFTTARGQQVQAQFNVSIARAQLLAALGRRP